MSRNYASQFHGPVDRLFRNDEKALGAVVTCVINDDNAAEGTSGNTRLREEIAKKSGSHV